MSSSCSQTDRTSTGSACLLVISEDFPRIFPYHVRFSPASVQSVRVNASPALLLCFLVPLVHFLLFHEQLFCCLNSIRDPRGARVTKARSECSNSPSAVNGAAALAEVSCLLLGCINAAFIFLSRFLCDCHSCLPLLVCCSKPSGHFGLYHVYIYIWACVCVCLYVSVA